LAALADDLAQREHGHLPFAVAGLRAVDALGDLGASLDRGGGQKGMAG